MGIVSRTLKFKDEHLSHYWVRVLCFAFSIVFLALWVMSDDAGATTVSIFNVTDHPPSPYFNLEGTHTLDDYTAVAYGDDDGNLMLAYRQPGDSWSYVEIADRDFLSGTTDWQSAGTLTTSNNSIVIYADFTPSGTLTTCFWIKYNESDWDDWEYIPIAPSGYGAVCFDINDTDKICALDRSSGTLRAGIYDFDTDVWDHDMAPWYSAGNNFGEVVANKTGVFWIAYGAGGNWGYIRDYDKNEAPITFPSQQYTDFWMDMVCLDNDCFYITWVYSFGGNKKPALAYQATVQSGFTNVWLNAGYGGWSTYTSISIAQNSTTAHLFFYEFDEGALYRWSAPFGSNDGTWQASQTSIDEPDDWDNPVGGFNRIWPRYEGTTSFTQPDSGWIVTIWEDGDEDPLFNIHDGLSWSGDLMPLEEPDPDPDPDPDPGGDGDGIGEICSSNWLILVVMLVMLIAIVGMAAQIG